MISGIFLTQTDSSTSTAYFQECKDRLQAVTLYGDDRLLLVDYKDPVSMGEKEAVMENSDRYVLAAAGEPVCGTDSLLQLYQAENGDSRFLSRIRGSFAFLVYDKKDASLFMARDHFGIEPLYYCEQDGVLIFSSTIKGVVSLRNRGAELFHPGLGNILLFNYNTGNRTIIKGISRFPAANMLQATAGKISFDRYWTLSFDQQAQDEGQLATKLLAELREAVKDSLGSLSQTGVFLSGGMDSSTMLALSRELGIDLTTFSYRCRAASFDESHYARIMAEFVGSSHNECEYSSDEVLLMPEVVGAMNEPFCDVGINIATYLLGRKAGEQGCASIITGDGGDELFGGHPVYEADKIGRYADMIPRPLLAPALGLFRLLPDSDQKKNLTVKLKRFSESMVYPKELLSHRWRIYYNDRDLQRIIGKEFVEGLDWDQLLEDLFAINAGARGDMLSQSLHSDYQSVVDFYLRRNDLIRRFGINVRYPMFNPRLVEFCAKMPTEMKINGWFDTKYIFKKAMEPVLPHEIIYRKDKLGHSIPLKNWIRDDKKVREMILDHLTGDNLYMKNLFNQQEVTRFVNDHMSKKKNNSHRLWTLAVIEMWLRKQFSTYAG